MSASHRRPGPRRPAALGLILAGLVLSACSAGGFSGDPTPPPADEPIRNYVAIGDGFAAAPFNGKVDLAKGCRRSEGNYPARVAAALGAALTDVSCNGATSDAVLVTAQPPNGKGRLAAQIAAVKANTDLVTITIGIMDQGLLYRAFSVCMALPCSENQIPAKTLADSASASGTSIDTIVRQIRERAPQARIILVGYPQIAPPDQGCNRIPSLTPAELSGVNTLFATVNANLRDAAFATGTEFIDIARLGASHHACSDQPWMRTARPPQGLAAALMPLPAEQQAVARAVLEAIRER